MRISPAGTALSYISGTILRCAAISRWLNSSILLRQSCKGKTTVGQGAGQEGASRCRDTTAQRRQLAGEPTCMKGQSSGTDLLLSGGSLRACLRLNSVTACCRPTFLSSWEWLFPIAGPGRPGSRTFSSQHGSGSVRGLQGRRARAVRKLRVSCDCWTHQLLYGGDPLQYSSTNP
jgi:hypothetical protein